MKRCFLITLLFLLFCSLGASEFEKLKALDEQGVQNPDLYYNLGVTYWQTGQSGMASLYFLKALHLDSAHKAARENLNYSIRLSKDRDLYPQRLFLVRVFLEVYDFMNMNRMAVLNLGLLILSSLSLLWYINYDPAKERGLPGLVLGTMLCLLLISVSVSAFKAYRIKGNRQAVLLEESAELRENPEDSAKRVATIHEGVILDIRKTAGDWLFVNLPNGDGGWINGELVGRVQQ